MPDVGTPARSARHLLLDVITVPHLFRIETDETELTWSDEPRPELIPPTGRLEISGLNTASKNIRVWRHGLRTILQTISKLLLVHACMKSAGTTYCWRARRDAR